jgi:hypothetical protein
MEPVEVNPIIPVCALTHIGPNDSRTSGEKRGAPSFTSLYFLTSQPLAVLLIGGYHVNF